MKKVFKQLLTASMLIITSIPVAQAVAVTYNVTGTLLEPMTQPLNTVFNGSFNWDGFTVTDLHGTMNSSMYLTDDINPDYASTFPLMYLNHQLSQNVDGNIVTASVFLENTTDVFLDGGYQTGDMFRYGSTVFGSNDNEYNDNAYFTFSFDKTDMSGVLETLAYADCTAGGMMGEFCMTGHKLFGTMSASPLSLQISAVPIPAAVWLFGSALLGMIGVSRKRTLSV